MKKPLRPLTLGRASLALLAVALAPSHARAQADLNPPLPNVLLLVDTSGSMEYKTDGTEVTCNPGNLAGVNGKSRWVDLVEVLTGSIKDYTCQEINRLDSTVGFRLGEYALGGDPYDYRYPIPYHRPLSAGCAPAPGAQSSNPFVYPTVGGVSYHNWSNAASCTFSQPGNDGVLDVFQDYVRFGLMTFDTSTDAGTGFGGAMASATADSTTGKAGLWSYVVGSSAVGKPSGCTTASTPQEVGARNAAAPPWEGRMVNFGNPYDGVREYINKNKHIQEVLLATRPYGATPIAGMLKDAEDFLINDKSKDPDRNPSSLSDSDVASDFGPWQDPYLTCDMGRQQVVILLTDGQPNMDLRPYCTDNSETPLGVCPFDLPEDITKRLYTVSSTHKSIPTYVVGFALDKVDHDNNPATTALDCSTITASDVDTASTTNLCNKPANASNLPLQACCTLQRIALAGGRSAFFASNRETLRSQLSQILSSQRTATSRTQPVQAATGGGGGAGGTFRFFTGFKPGNLKPWTGTLERQRFTCATVSSVTSAKPEKIEPDDGDDFVHNVAKAGPDARLVYSVLGGASSSDDIKSLNTIRPNIGTTDKDGVGTYGGRYISGNSANFITKVDFDALAIPATSCIDQNGVALATETACRDLYMKWWLGYDNGQSTVTSRCPLVGTASCQLVGDIIHSTPIVVDRPAAGIRDESYARFEILQAKRPMMLYVSSNDGLLHAFKVTSNDPADFADDSKMVRNDGQSNELWTFAPPAVLPNIHHLYPYNHQVLLDGMAVRRDVVAVQPTDPNDIPTVFERSVTDAISGAAAWRTVLVQGLGYSHSGYFALDVTNPVPDSTDPDDVTKGGPRMLWQLTRDKDGANNLFGRGGGTPAITTLFFDPEGGSDVREIPVAVLPGGPGGTQVTTGPGCPASGRTYSDLSLDTDFPPRERVHCYNFPNDEAGARSLTIVRLDTGEIIRTFRLSKSEVSDELKPRTTEADLDAPITGQPVVFPALVGQVADRIFVGDAEGRLFKVDVASTNPADWTMKLFFDLYPASFKSTTGHGFDAGQPIMIPPVVSVDDYGNLVLDVASGDQEGLAAAPNLKNYVYSLTEQVNVARTAASTKVNWYKAFKDGERVVGPMALFSSSLYFATYEPPTAANTSSALACSNGTSHIWQASYLDALGDDPTAGPEVLNELANFDAVTAGLAAVQDPDCSTTVTDPAGDPILGYGRHVKAGNISPGKFKLVYQTGNLKLSGTEGGVDADAEVGVAEVVLPTPKTLSSVESWASIVE
jgi:type IV pilus assembly protein PilY1